MGNEPRKPRGAGPLDPQSPEARLARSRTKRESFTRLLLDQGFVGVRLDARRMNVEVPDEFMDDHGLNLDVWWKPPDAPMKLNERGVAATLRFDGEQFRCLIPWTAIWGIRTARTETLQVWEVDLPVELGGLPIPEGLTEEPVEPRPRLVQLVDLPELTPGLKSTDDKPPTRPNLRLIK